MKRFLIFTALYPVLGLAVFTAPDRFSNFVDWLGYAYLLGVFLAWLTAAADWKLSASPNHLRILGTACTGALMTGSMAFFLWSGFNELFATLMVVLVGAVPAAVCSWLSTETPA